MSVIVMVTAGAAALLGLLWPGSLASEVATTVRGDSVRLSGHGLYRYETALRSGANQGSDLVTLLLAIPVLALANHRYWRRSVGAALLVAGALSWFVYVSASMALGAMYNALFLVYVAVLSTSAFALGAVIRSVPVELLAARLEGVAPRRATAWLMVCSGLVTAVVWLGPLVGAAVSGRPPALLDHYTTMVTDVLDLALITPATLLAAWWLLRRRAEGYVLAVPLLALLVALLPMIASQTAFQVAAGVSFTPGEIVGPVGGFVVLAAWALPLLARTLRAADRGTPA
ncbi:MAG TPA: hypothetical protein VFJ94_16195 [Intrasporangium sp.]|uniref:hypothetical protein n=1 Tax=Intrasporangium sp. TaxID=1925024 RepID=UPI002D78028A|nr:hypothetical protein [Intrasporangium sp.]HET7400058.1 hypothetical protein [Intrasporangium sp.]